MIEIVVFNELEIIELFPKVFVLIIILFFTVLYLYNTYSKIIGNIIEDKFCEISGIPKYKENIEVK